MELAYIFNMKTRRRSRVPKSVPDMERRYFGNKALGIVPTHPEEAADIVALSPKDDMPVRLSPSYRAKAGKEIVPGHWARPNGFGDHDHVFDHIPMPSLSEALESGKMVLINLNLDLGIPAEPSEHFYDPFAQRFNEWLLQTRGKYVTVSANSLSDILKISKRISALKPDAPGNDLISVRQGDIVLPWSAFYLGANKTRHMAFHDALQKKRSGTRAMSAVRLFRLDPTETTVQEKGAQGLKGNYVRLKGKELFSRLFFPNHDDTMRTPVYENLRTEIISPGGGAYILAPASITVVDPKIAPRSKMGMLRWVVGNIEAGTQALDEKTKQRILAQKQAIHDRYASHSFEA